MKLIKGFLLLMVYFAADVRAFNAVEVDKALSKFLNGLSMAECGEVEYSFIRIMYVEDAYKYGFYGDRWHPSDFNPPKLGTDIFIDAKTNICGWEDGYGITFRKEGGDYKVVGYSSFSQPE